MENEEVITVESFCTYYNIDYSFVQLLQEHGLIRINVVEQKDSIDKNDLVKLEKFISMYYELNINVEGIDALTHMLDRIQHLQEEVRNLRNKLHRYE